MAVMSVPLRPRVMAQPCLARPRVALVDELQRVGVAIGEIVRVQTLLAIVSKNSCQRASVMAPRPLVSGIARQRHAIGLHLVDRLGDQVVGHLGIVALDQRVSRRRIAVEIVHPALDRRVDEGLHDFGPLGDPCVGHQHHVRVAGIAVVGEQKTCGVNPPSFSIE